MTTQFTESKRRRKLYVGIYPDSYEWISPLEIALQSQGLSPGNLTDSTGKKSTKCFAVGAIFIF